MITFEKFNLNDKPKFIEFKTFQKELETNVSLMTKNISIKTIKEICKSNENIELCDEEDKINSFNIEENELNF